MRYLLLKYNYNHTITYLFKINLIIYNEDKPEGVGGCPPRSPKIIHKKETIKLSKNI